jgi:hypothetical protein
MTLKIVNSGTPQTAAHVSMDRRLSSSIAAATKALRAEVLVVLFAVEVPHVGDWFTCLHLLYDVINNRFQQGLISIGSTE